MINGGEIMKAMNNKVYGIIGLASKFSNFNGDLEGNPRCCEGVYHATNFALKYTVKDFWNRNGELVLGLKSINQDGKFNTLEQRCNLLFNNRLQSILGEKKGKGKSKTKAADEEQAEEIPEEVAEIEDGRKFAVMADVLKCMDAACFGVAFPVTGCQFNIAGAVQITEGTNLYKYSELVEEQLLSPYLNPKRDKGENTTLGRRAILNEAHYFYGLSINPNCYKEYEKLLAPYGFEGFTQDMYEKLKDGLLYGVSGIQSITKIGCENEFGLFVNCKENMNPNMANLQQYVDYVKEPEDNVGTIDLTRLYQYLDGYKKHINNIEIYYNPITTKIAGQGDINTAFYSIFDKEEIKEEKLKRGA